MWVSLELGPSVVKLLDENAAPIDILIIALGETLNRGLL